jgi:hypothetical protein
VASLLWAVHRKWEGCWTRAASHKYRKRSCIPSCASYMQSTAKPSTAHSKAVMRAEHRRTIPYTPDA